MSQRDLVAELRSSRSAAPADLRERVRSLGAAAAPPRGRFTWRRALLVALPAAAAIAAAIVVTRPGADPPVADSSAATPSIMRAQSKAAAPVRQPGLSGSVQALAPPPARGRIQQYGAFLALRVPDPDGVSNGVKRALQIAAKLGGHPTSVHADTTGRAAAADLTLKVPRARVQEAITMLSTLGAITSEQVDVQDLQAGLNAADRTIARAQARLARLRATEQTDAVRKQIAALTTRIERLQRAESAKIRAAHFATISLHLETARKAAPAPHRHGPLHGLGVAFRWIGIGAVYVLALGAPLAVLTVLAWLAARAIRRRREDALLGA